MAKNDDVLTRSRARVGRVLREKWRLDHLVGVGGTGAVYAARHRAGKRVAVKIMHLELVPNEAARARFLREAYLANCVNHPGAMSVLDDDVDDDGCAFLVTELLEGETVARRWARSDHVLGQREVIWIADKLLDVLIVAHAAGVVHRDIKPDNLFLMSDGGFKVLDFGLARLQQARSTTLKGITIGTPAYMSPEHAMGRWNEVDGRADLWSVGATMFTLLSGRHVHQGATHVQQLAAAMCDPAPSLAAVAGHVPPGLVAVVDRALSFDQRDRWADARAMQQALRRAYMAIDGAPSPRGIPKLYDDDESIGLAPTEVASRGPFKPAQPSPAHAVGDGSYDTLTSSSQQREPKIRHGHGRLLAQAYINRGVSRQSEGNHHGAIEDYSAALELMADSEIAYYNRGTARQMLGDVKGAVLDYTKAISRNPRLGDAYYNRALLYLCSGDRGAAARDCDNALRLYREGNNAHGVGKTIRLQAGIGLEADATPTGE